MKRSDLKELIKKSMLEVSPKSGAMTPEEEKMVADYDEEQANKYALDKEEPMEEGSVILNRDEVYAKYAPLVKQYMASGLDRLAAITKAEHVLAKEYGATPLNIQSTISDYFDDQYRNSTYANENVLREADEIVAAYTKKKTLKEAAPSSANASKIAKLQKERDQIMHDMEQEAEPEGGPVADEYGAMLDKIDAQIRKLKGLKETASIKEEMTGGYLEIMEMNPKFDQGIEMLLEVWEEWKSGEMTEPEMIDEAKQDLLSYLSSVLD